MKMLLKMYTVTANFDMSQHSDLKVKSFRQLSNAKKWQDEQRQDFINTIPFSGALDNDETFIEDNRIQLTSLSGEDFFTSDILEETIEDDRLHEVIADISMTAGYMIAEGKISIDDSREFINSVLPDLAMEFELNFTKQQEEDGLYMELVDKFAVYQLTEIYGIEHSVIEDDEPETVELYIEEGKTVLANRKALEDYVTSHWDYDDLQDFLDNYIHDDAWVLYENVPGIFER